MMAKTAEPLVAAKYPAELPAGIVRWTSPRTVSGPTTKDKDGKSVPGDSVKATVTFIGPAENTAEGLRNMIALLSDLGKASGQGDDYGIRFACGALRSAVVAGIAAKLTPETVEQSTAVLPPVPSVRTVDPFEAATAKLADEYRAKAAKGETMNEKEIAARFKALMGGK